MDSTVRIKATAVLEASIPGDETTAVFTRILATRAAFAYPYTTAAAQAPPNDAPTLSTRSPSSESPVKTLTSEPKTSVFSSPAGAKLPLTEEEDRAKILSMYERVKQIAGLNEAGL